jgi:hypothetical protein
VELERCIRWLAPASLLVLAAAAIPTAPPGAQATDRAGIAAGTCPSKAGTRAAAVDAHPSAWFRLDPVLDASGTLVGQRLSAGMGGAGWSADLPAESFASGPVQGAVLVGDDDGSRSRLRLLDAGRGCWTHLAEEASVIRSAVLAPDGTAAWEHRVDRATRADLGVWRRQVGGGPADGVRRVLPGLAPDAAYGPTFATDLSLAADGRLVVASCGERTCRTRVLDPADGTVRTADPTGPAVGVVGGRLVALGPCLGLPCPVIGIDLDTGATRTIGMTAGPAVLAGADGSLLVVTTADGEVEVVDAAAGVRRPDRVAGSTGLAPVLRGSTATSGVETGPLAMALAPGGRIAGPSSVQTLDPATRTLTRPTEVLP